MTVATEFKVLSLEDLHESAHNPRRHFDQSSLSELAESIRTVGVLTPLLVRPNAKGYEIAAGHRRFRAAQLAKVPQVPCVIRPLTDQQFMEILTIENLQREDVHPLDEAKGYEVLMAAPYKMPVEKIAERVGRSNKYVYDRVKLLDLCKAAQQYFWDGLIEAGHAILLARLSQDEQIKVIGNEDFDFKNGGLFEQQVGLYRQGEGDDDRGGIKARSVRELGDWIKRNIRFDMGKVDSFLFPETAKQLAESRGAKLKPVEITTEYICSDSVRSENRKARVLGERAWKRADGLDGSKTCEFSRLGVNVSGEDQGEAFQICMNKDRCDVHWGKEKKQRDKAKKQREQSLKEAGGDRQKAQEIQRQKDRKEQLAALEESRVLRETVVAIMAKVKGTLKVADVVLIATDHVRQMIQDGMDRDVRGLLGFKDEYPSDNAVASLVEKHKDPMSLMFFASLLANIASWNGGGKQVFAAAGRYKIDIKKIRKAVKDQLAKNPPNLDGEEDE